jgi:hypothetical protein
MIAVGPRLGRVWAHWACPAVLRRLQPSDRHDQRSSVVCGGADAPPGVWLGRGVRTFSVSRLQSEAAVDPVSERWPLQAGDDPRGVRRTPLHDPVWERGRQNFSENLPDRPHVTMDPPRRGRHNPTACGLPQPTGAPPSTVAIDEPYGASIPDRGDPGLLRPLLRDPPQQSADLGLAVAPMPSQRPD